MSVITITKDNFQKEIAESKVPVLVDFWASWCGPCRMVAPVVEEIAEGAQDFKVGKVNVDEQSALAQKYNVMSIPTLIVFKNGVPAETAVGVRPKAAILKMLGK